VSRGARFFERASRFRPYRDFLERIPHHHTVQSNNKNAGHERRFLDPLPMTSPSSKRTFPYALFDELFSSFLQVTPDRARQSVPPSRGNGRRPFRGSPLYASRAFFFLTIFAPFYPNPFSTPLHIPCTNLALFPFSSFHTYCVLAEHSLELDPPSQ